MEREIIIKQKNAMKLNNKNKNNNNNERFVCFGFLLRTVCNTEYESIFFTRHCCCLLIEYLRFDF